MPRRRLLLCVLSLVAGWPSAFGQSLGVQDDDIVPEQPQQQQKRQQSGQDTAPPGRVVESTVGRAGQRQAREDVAVDVHPMKRISNRIENRVQSRIRNRIDPDYDPQANAKSPFAVAEEATRSQR